MKGHLRSFLAERVLSQSAMAPRPLVAALIGLLVVACAVPPSASAGGIPTRQTITKYVYNDDGALTSIVTTGDGVATKTTYVTWDDFIPDAADPTTGTTMIGNGTLAALGPAPGVQNADERFEFDARDRLRSVTVGGLTETYDYHAGRALASSSLDGDSLHFYQNSDQYSEITNIYQDSTGLWDAYVGPGRYLSDGREEILLQPRKDMACSYDPDGRTLQSYVYDIFGFQGQGQTRQTYDLSENPFQYAGEYRDPIWGGVYLRTRWYDPDLPLFVSRDPLPNLNRYGYAGGNPVMRIDPGGMNFFHALRKASEVLNAGIGGHFARIFLAPVLGPLQILADPKGFWQQIKTDKDGIDIFLAVGVVTQIGWMGAEGYGLSSYVRNLSFTKRVLGRLAFDAALDVGQSLAVGADRGFSHFDKGAFWQNIELSVGTLGWDRLAGKGVNPYTLKGEDVARQISELNDSNTVLIFRERTGRYHPTQHTSPLQEWRNVGKYHERIVAVSKKFYASNELVYADAEHAFARVHSKLNLRAAEGIPIEDIVKKSRGRFQLVGTARNFRMSEFLQMNPRGILSEGEAMRRARTNNWVNVPKGAHYSKVFNNCHDHAAAVLRQLEFQ
jgi:RHS repeat-associated protein